MNVGRSGIKPPTCVRTSSFNTSDLLITRTRRFVSHKISSVFHLFKSTVSYINESLRTNFNAKTNTLYHLYQNVRNHWIKIPHELSFPIAMRSFSLKRIYFTPFWHFFCKEVCCFCRSLKRIVVKLFFCKKLCTNTLKWL